MVPHVIFVPLNEDQYGTGTVAYLSVPYVFDGGRKAVSAFMKKLNGNWLSVPGQDVYFTSMAKLLAGGAKVAYVEVVAPDSAEELAQIKQEIEDHEDPGQLAKELGLGGTLKGPLPESKSISAFSQYGGMKVAGALVAVGGVLALLLTGGKGGRKKKR